jgi:ribosome-associated translation inhibitor RaiA
VRGVRELIRSLNPRRARRFAKDEANYVIPDVVVRKVRNQWQASLNEAAMPKLRLNRIYADILTRNRDRSNQQLAAQLQEAKWLIRNVQQRFETILRVTQAIVERQRRFFEQAKSRCGPMVLREIADMLDLHESTNLACDHPEVHADASAALSSSSTFFGSHVATERRCRRRPTAIRALIKQLVAAENPQSPLTDSRIAELLGEQGIIVARRTIAKYRRRCRSRRSICARPSSERRGICEWGRRRHHLRRLDRTSTSPAFISTSPPPSCLRRVQARAGEPPLRSRDRRERGAVGGQAAQKIEANVHVRGKDIHAEAIEPDMYAAIDCLADKLNRQVLKYKEKLSDHRADRDSIERQLTASAPPQRTTE